MTLQEAVQTSFQLFYDEKLTYMSCMDAGINPTDNYTLIRQKDRDYAVCFCLLAVYQGVSVTEGGYTINYKQADIAARIKILANKWEFDDVLGQLLGGDGFVEGVEVW